MLQSNVESHRTGSVFRAFKKKWGPRISSWVPLEFWHTLLGVELVLPRYHVVSDEDPAHLTGLIHARSVRQFKADVEFFLKHYTPITLTDIIASLDGTGRLPKRCFLLSFDDGFRELYDVVAPILNAQGVPAVFFVATSLVDNRELCYLQKKSLLFRTPASYGDTFAGRTASQLLAGAGIEGPDLRSRIHRIAYRQRYLLDELESVMECDFAAYVATARP
ncbi:MAG TPA: polysaccharide deacetylase family protein, partial [Dissulfurispiraceae bacterium]